MGIRTVLLLAIASLAAGCAEAGKEGFTSRPDGGTEQRIDSGTQQRIDAATGIDSGGGGGIDASSGGGIDASSGGGGGTPQTLSATNDTTDDQNPVACGTASYTDTESFYRVFPLADFGITGGFSVSSLDLTMDVAIGDITATYKVGTYNGTPGATLTKSKISALATMTQAMMDGDTEENVAISADIPAGSVLVVEIDAPSGESDDSVFAPADSSGGETEKSYLSASGCNNGSTAIDVMSTLAGTESDLLLTVTGTAD